MAETIKHPCPPYATFSAFINFLNKLRDTQVPGRIDPSVFGKASGSLSYSIIAALKALKLIAADGTPKPDFIALVKADDDGRKNRLTHAMQAAFPTLYGGSSFDVTNATASQFDEHIRTNYEAKGSTVDKVASFYIAACAYSDVEISDLVKARKPTASSASSGKSKRQRKIDVEPDNSGAGQKPPPLTPITEKLLEYRLVDLMAEAMDDPEVLQAIIKVVTFLKARDAKPKKKAVDETPTAP